MGIKKAQMMVPHLVQMMAELMTGLSEEVKELWMGVKMEQTMVPHLV